MCALPTNQNLAGRHFGMTPVICSLFPFTQSNSNLAKYCVKITFRIRVPTRLRPSKSETPKNRLSASQGPWQTAGPDLRPLLHYSTQLLRRMPVPAHVASAKDLDDVASQPPMAIRTKILAKKMQTAAMPSEIAITITIGVGCGIFISKGIT